MNAARHVGRVGDPGGRLGVGMGILRQPRCGRRRRVHLTPRRRRTPPPPTGRESPAAGRAAWGIRPGPPREDPAAGWTAPAPATSAHRVAAAGRACPRRGTGRGLRHPCPTALTVSHHRYGRRPACRKPPHPLAPPAAITRGTSPAADPLRSPGRRSRRTAPAPDTTVVPGGCRGHGDRGRLAAVSGPPRLWPPSRRPRRRRWRGPRS